MTQCSSEFAVFGIRVCPSRTEIERLNKILEDDPEERSVSRLYAEFGADLSDITQVRFMDWLVAVSERMRRAYKLPEISGDSPGLVWTGSDDSRPGESNTESEQWLFGIGLRHIVDYALNDPGSLMGFVAEYKAEWHTWSTVS